jgi:hypothetical protein
MTTLLEQHRARTAARMSEAKELWNGLIPFCAVPPDDTLQRWIARFTAEELLHGFKITASKFSSLAGTTFDSERLYRYTTSILHSERNEGAR